MTRVAERIGEYRIERLISRTPDCIEYRGEHLVLPRRAVIKVMAPGVTPLPVLREACILEALQHPGVVRVFESGLLPDRRPWFARELVDGGSIASMLAPGAIDRMDVIALLRDLAEVVAHAHSRGIVHANLRPDKIVLTGRARGYPLCITDWSDARAHDTTSPAHAPSIASQYYTAPEVAAGEGLDDRADVFSLGVIAYRLLTGMLPFQGTVATTIDGRRQHTPTELRCPDAPRELTGMVDQMLAHDRWDRPSAGEVHSDLEWLGEVLSASRGLRIRRPRWTPALDFTPHDRQRNPDLEVDPIVEGDES